MKKFCCSWPWKAMQKLNWMVFFGPQWKPLEIISEYHLSIIGTYCRRRNLYFQQIWKKIFSYNTIFQGSTIVGYKFHCQLGMKKFYFCGIRDCEIIFVQLKSSLPQRLENIKKKNVFYYFVMSMPAKYLWHREVLTNFDSTKTGMIHVYQ